MNENDKYYYKYKKYKQKYKNKILDLKQLKKNYYKLRKEYNKMLQKINLQNNIKYIVTNNKILPKDVLNINNQNTLIPDI